jgi:hypothetical protein
LQSLLFETQLSPFPSFSPPTSEKTGESLEEFSFVYVIESVDDVLPNELILNVGAPSNEKITSKKGFKLFLQLCFSLENCLTALQQAVLVVDVVDSAT